MERWQLLSMAAGHSCHYSSRVSRRLGVVGLLLPSAALSKAAKKEAETRCCTIIGIMLLGGVSRTSRAAHMSHKELRRLLDGSSINPISPLCHHPSAKPNKHGFLLTSRRGSSAATVSYRCTGPILLEKKSQGNKALFFPKMNSNERLVRPQGHPQREEVNDEEDSRGDGEAP